MVKTCVGTEFCRFGTQDSTGAGIEMERRFEQLFTPHKVKMARRRLPAQLRRGDRQGHRPRRRRKAAGRWSSAAPPASRVRKADLLTTVETTDAGARGVGAVLPVLPRERQLPRTHLRLRRAPRASRRSARTPSTRRSRCGKALLDRLRKSKARAARCVARRADAEARRRSSSRSQPMETGDWHERTRSGFGSRRCDNIPLREGRAVHAWRPRDRASSTSAIGSSRPTTSVRTRAARCATASSPATSVVCPLHAWKINLETGAVERPAHGTGHVRRRPIRRASRTASSRSSCRTTCRARRPGGMTR